MCPSSWKLYLDDLPVLGSSLAHLEPKLQLFEVWEMMVRQIIIANGINSQPPKLQTALVWVLDERNQKKSSKHDLQDDGHISSSPVVRV